MNFAKLSAACFAFLATPSFLAAQQSVAQPTDLHNQPSATFGNDRPKSSKPSKFRTIQGVVEDHGENPVSGAIVQLKDMRTSKVIDFATKEDGKFAFHDLRLDVNYELLAKRGELATPVKKVTIYDTRNNVIINFKLEPPEPPAKQ